MSASLASLAGYLRRCTDFFKRIRAPVAAPVKSLTLLCERNSAIELNHVGSQILNDHRVHQVVLRVYGNQVNRKLAAADIILLGPQVKYEQAKLQAMADPFGKKVAVIDMMDYGMMKGDAVLDKALKLME